MKNIRIKEIKCSNELRRFLVSMEVNCTVDCCKANAFEVDANSIDSWRANEFNNYDDMIYNELFELKQLNLSDYNFVRLNIRDLESQWGITEFSDFIDLVLNKFHKVIY